jgi:hypothetical protein
MMSHGILGTSFQRAWGIFHNQMPTELSLQWPDRQVYSSPRKDHNRQEAFTRFTANYLALITVALRVDLRLKVANLYTRR